MSRGLPTPRQLRGLQLLATDAVDAAVRRISVTHLEIAHVPFALLRRIEPLAEPVGGIERAHDAVTRGVYGAILGLNGLVGAVAGTALDLLAKNAGARDHASPTMQPLSRGAPVAKPNYQFEKRQKELAKKKAQEEKRQRKLARTEPAGEEAAEGSPPTDPAAKPG